MQSGLLLALARLGSDLPWYLVGCAPFLDRLRVKKRTLLLLIFGVGLARALVSYALIEWVPGGHDYLGFEYVAFTAIIILFYIRSMQIRPAQLVYIMLLLQALATTVNYLAYVVNVPFYPGGTIRATTTPSYVFSIIAGTLLCAVPVWLFFKRRLRPALDALPCRTVWMLCIPPALFWMIHQVYTSTVAYSQSTVNIAILSLLILLTGLTVYYLNIKMVVDSAKHTRLKSEAETRLALQAQNYENLTQSIEAARAARHDLRHHINALQDFAARDDKAGMLRYLEEYTATLPVDETPDWCENRTVNALLKHYLSQAARAGVKLDVRLHIPLHAGVPDTELCVVFGNIFENAAGSAGAAGAGASLHARCETGERDLVLTVENSIGAEAPHGEGLGLKNVEAAAKKRGGTARFEKKDGVFYSRVILKKEPPQNEQETALQEEIIIEKWRKGTHE